MIREVMIRPFRKEYHDGLKAMIKTCFEDIAWPFEPEGKDRDLEYILSEYLASGGIFYVLFIDNRIAGSIALKHQGRFYILKRFYILPKYRGCGYGKLLLSHLLDGAREKSVKTLFLDTHSRKSAAYHLFQKTGFQECTAPYRDSFNEIYMKIDLRKFPK